MAASHGLGDWEDVRDNQSWSSLLIGNGFSRNLSPTFDYQSLFEKATLSQSDQDLFAKSGADFNFEQVLLAIQHGRDVAQVLGVDHKPFAQAYKRIQEALADAVLEVHPTDLAPEILRHLEPELACFNRVYSTNYDLLIYWAIMYRTGGEPRVEDFFTRDGGNGDLYYSNHFMHDPREATCVYYLHGGVHLTQRPTDDRTLKRERLGGDLLGSIRSEWADPSQPPLIVTEGNHQAKRSAIAANEYLWDCLQALETDGQPIVILGQGLKDQDSHIAEAVLHGHPNGRQVAVGVYPASITAVEVSRAHCLSRLGVEVTFFDSTTHPLTQPGLVPVPGAIRKAIIPPLRTPNRTR